MRLLFLLIPLLLAVTAHAADESLPQFDVEIIVFRHVDGDRSELPARLGEDDAARPRRVRYPAVPSSELQLGAVNSVLLRSSQWSPLLHAGWRQPAGAHGEASAMAVAGARGGARVDGSVRLSLDRFLRLELDLRLDDGSGMAAELRQARRVRSGRLHYFDHPQFGVIALVTPRG